MGIKHLLIQAFTCPDPHETRSYEIFAESMGMQRLWPPRRLCLVGPYRLPRFPPKRSFSDPEAMDLADRFHERVKAIQEADAID
jgi:hypothetical protein